jgi:beta-lactamase superfamily II metal-dependent hydrolase
VDVNEGSLLYIAGLSSFDQDQLISQRVNLNCDVLASSSSNDESSLSNEFLAESQPSVVTLSNSQESPPSDEVLGRLKAADVTIARTDISGAINIGISSDPSIAPKFYSSNSIIPLN